MSGFIELAAPKYIGSVLVRYLAMGGSRALIRRHVWSSDLVPVLLDLHANVESR